MRAILRFVGNVIVAYQAQPFNKNSYSIAVASLLANPFVIAVAALVVAAIILVAVLLLFRSSGKKKKANAAASSDWQRQGQQTPPPGWNQQGQQPNTWDAQQYSGGWNANAAQQQRVQSTPPPMHLYQPTLSIFISHSAKDDDFGRKLVQDLRQAFRSDEVVWYDSEGGLYGGESWWGRIVTELGKCDVFIIVLSPNSMNSKWVMKELDIANVEGKRVVPILYSQCDIRPDLRAIQIISFLEPIPYGAAFNNLLQALKH
jgi:TIR domain